MKRRGYLQYFRKTIIVFLLIVSLINEGTMTVLAANQNETEEINYFQQESELSFNGESENYESDGIIEEFESEYMSETDIQTEQSNTADSIITNETDADATTQLETEIITGNYETENVGETEESILDDTEQQSETDERLQEDNEESEISVKNERLEKSAYNEISYSPSDIAVINNIIDVNGLQAEKNQPKKWEDDGIVQWESVDYQNVKEIRILNLSNTQITGVLNLSGLSNLYQFIGSNNSNLTGFILNDLPKLQFLECERSGIKELDISNVPSIYSVKFANNQIEKINMTGTDIRGTINFDYNPVKEIKFSDSCTVKINADQNLENISVGIVDARNRILRLYVNTVNNYRFLNWEFDKTVIFKEGTDSFFTQVTFSAPDDGVVVSTNIVQINTNDIAIAKSVANSLSTKDFTLKQELAPTKEAIVQQLVEKIRQLDFVKENGVEIDASYTNFFRYDEAIAGDEFKNDGINGKFGFSIFVKKGYAEEQALIGGILRAKPFGTWGDQYCIEETSELLEDTVFFVESAYNTSQNEKEILKQIKKIPGIDETGVKISADSIYTSTSAEDGTLDRPEGKDGLGYVALKIQKGNLYVTRYYKTIIRAVNFSDPVDYKDLQTVVEVKKIIEKLDLTMDESMGISRDSVEKEILRRINTQNVIAKSGIVFKTENFEGWMEIINSQEGTLDDSKGKNGSFSGVDVIIKKGKAKDKISLSGVIKATPFENTEDGRQYKALQKAKQKIDSFPFELNQKEAFSEEATMSELYALINQITDVEKEEIYIYAISIDKYIDAEQGTELNPAGKDGIVELELGIAKGIYEVSSKIKCRIVATAYSESQLDRDMKAVQNVKNIISSRNFVMDQKLGWNEYAAIEEVLRQINSISEVMQFGGVVNRDFMYPIVDYISASEGNVNVPGGFDGYIKFRIVISKGEAEDWIWVESEIKASPYIEKIDPAEIEAVEKVRKLIDGCVYKTNQKTAFDYFSAVRELTYQINADINNEQTGVIILQNDINAISDFEPAQSGTVRNLQGVDGGGTFNITIFKGKAHSLAQVSLVISATPLKGKWKKNSKGWWYETEIGDYPKMQWANVDGEQYYFDSNGYMKTGWQRISGNWYYLKSSGAMATGWQRIGGVWYYLKDDGIMATGWQQVDGSWYYLKSSGAMATGWQKLGGSWYYLKSGGAMATGWQRIGGVWYYLKDDGVMATGWQQVNGVWYYLKSSGAMATGWQKLGGSWYYLKSSGAMATGWQRIGGVWYYLNDSGRMATGWQEIDGKWYYLKSSGAMAVGWLNTGGKWYYLKSNGEMATGWQRVGSRWYYLKESGAMATGWITVDGKKYYLNNSGAWVK